MKVRCLSASPLQRQDRKDSAYTGEVQQRQCHAGKHTPCLQHTAHLVLIACHQWMLQLWLERSCWVFCNARRCRRHNPFWVASRTVISPWPALLSMEDSTLCSAICSKNWIPEAVIVGLQDQEQPCCKSAWCFCKHCDRCLQVHANAVKFELSRCLFSCAGCPNVHIFIACSIVGILHVSYDALCQMYTHTDVVQSFLLGCCD